MYNTVNPNRIKQINMSTSEFDHCIKQNDEIILSGDSVSIGVVFRNLTGENFHKKEKEYKQYKKFVESQGFDLSRKFYMYHNETLLKEGCFCEKP